ncbi:cell wall-associated NlpC family hydrolase [Kitasatospora sp. GP30]|uniref:C40 family peptidase n=1 Tax=Kitasatospora sp. GP30 TaxID=3035084 RepID=UPI0024755FCE|nr:NlpC/P60 family protein [Kitasatospora sp. GP30]MDH6143119.1 cell wall-associated NlpC family hydrolase [Kitasatospora sp. GP30]
MKPKQKCPAVPVDPAVQDAAHAGRGGRLCRRLGLTAALVAGAGSIVLGADLAQAAPVAVASAARPGLVSADDATPAGAQAATDDSSSTDVTATADDTTAGDVTAGDDSDSVPVADDRSDDEQGGDNQGADDQATDDQNADVQGSDVQNADDQAADDQNADVQGSDVQNADDQATDDQNADVQGSDVQSADDGSATDSTASGDDNGGGEIHQGWDGSVYWFHNAAGEWRYTSHRDIYLNRTGSTPDHRRSMSPNKGSAGAHSATASHGSVEAAVKFALAQIGKPFVLGATGPNAYDCSGLIQRSFRQAGISLPRVANDQYAATTPIGASQLRRGDLLFWSYDGNARGIHHGAIYLGDGTYVEAPRAGANVRIHKLTRGYWPSQMGRA